MKPLLIAIQSTMNLYIGATCILSCCGMFYDCICTYCAVILLYCIVFTYMDLYYPK